MTDRLTVRVRQIRFEGVGIHSYELVDPQGGELPAFEPGAHIDVHLPDGVVRQYSLSNDPAERHRYVIAVLRDEAGRGGSKSLHETLRVQDLITISRPRNNFSLDPSARKVVLLAGGIGVTPLKSMAHRLRLARVEHELHYCAKDTAFTAFADEFAAIDEPLQPRFHFDGGDPARGLDIGALLRDHTLGTHLYYCGPAGFMKACAAASAHWPAGSVHFEHFKAPEPSTASAQQVSVDADSFVVKIASTGAMITVGSGTSIVEALHGAGVALPTSCESGLCGTCKVRYLSGEVDHRDYVLSDAEHAEFLTACVSRATSPVLTLDL